MSSEPLRFGTDGVRGVAGEGPLAPDSVARLGAALGDRLTAGEGPVLLGGDTRASREEITRALAHGLQSRGVDVVDCGVLPTAAMALLAPAARARCAAVISASHNPAEHNGIKLFDRVGEKLSDEDARWIEARWAELEAPPGLHVAPRRDEDGASRYLDHLRAATGALDLTGVRIGLDLAHGAAYRVGPELFRSLGAEVVAIGDAPDGFNINRDCGSQHPEGLSRLVREHGCALGLAVDGDADRAIFVDEHGTEVDGDRVLGLVAADLQDQGRLTGQTVVGTVMSNYGLQRFLEARDVTLVRTPVGDKHISAALRREGYVLGGEPSGHVIFGSDLSFLGDGLYTALRVLEVLRRRGRSLAEAAAPVALVPQVLIGVPVRERPPLDEISGFSEKLSEAEEALEGRGRLVVRYSGTEPLFRVMVEGVDAAEVQTWAEALAAHVRMVLGAEVS